MNLLSVYDFITSCLGRAKIIGSLSYEELPNVDKFHYTALKKHTHLSISPPILSEKALSMGNSQAPDGT